VRSLALEFKEFLLKGNVVMLAVAFIVATVFAAVVKAFVTDIITPIIGLIFGKPDFSALSFSINSSHFLYGDLINVAITFVSTAAAVFFFVVKPYQAFDARHAKEDTTIKSCPECLTEIPAKATRCFACTAQQPAAAG
jgi:large conductance mechanosensitive channel